MQILRFSSERGHASDVRYNGIGEKSGLTEKNEWKTTEKIETGGKQELINMQVIVWRF